VKARQYLPQEANDWPRHTLGSGTLITSPYKWILNIPTKDNITDRNTRFGALVLFCE